MWGDRRLRGSSRERRIDEHGRPRDHGQLHFRIGQLVERQVEQVPIDHHHVRLLAHLDRARRLVQVVHVGRAHGEGVNGRRKVDALVRQECFLRRSFAHHVRVATRLLAVDGDGHLPHRVGARHGPVTPEGEPCPRTDQTGEGVLPPAPLRAEEGDREVHHLALERGPQGLGVRHHPELVEPRDVVGMDHLDVGDVVAMVVRPVRSPRRLQGVQCLTDGPLPDRMDVDLKPLGVQKSHGGLQRLRVDERHTPIRGRHTVAVEIWIQDPGREILDHAVLHDLHRGGSEPPYRAPISFRDQLVDLLLAAVPVPPQGPDDPGRKLVPACRRGVGAERLVRATDDRVLPRGDAERVQVLLGHPEALLPFRLGDRGRDVFDQVHGPLVEGARGLARAVPFDPPVGRIGGLPGDAGQLQGSCVHPGPVAVTVRQVHRPVGDDMVQDVLGRGPAGERVHRPPSAPDPLDVGMLARVVGHDALVAFAGVRHVQVALKHLQAAGGRMEMLQCNLNVAYTREGYERIVADYASEHSDVEWIRGGGWSMDSFPGGTPTKEVLDRIVPDRPVYLPNRDGHGAWVNSRALELAGITRETPDPPDGRIERDADGDPSGTLHEGAMDLVDKLMPPVAQEEWEEGLRVAQRYLHSLGITAWQDAIVGGPYETLGAYTATAGRDELTARVVLSLWR